MSNRDRIFDTRAYVELGVTVAVLVLFAVAAYQALGFSRTARATPLLIAVLGLFLVTVKLVRDLVVPLVADRRRAAPARASEQPASTPDDGQPMPVTDEDYGEAAAQGTWSGTLPYVAVAALAVSWLVFGYAVGSILYVVFLTRVVYRERWLTTALLVAGVLVFFHFVMGGLLGMRLYGGMLGWQLPF